MTLALTIVGTLIFLALWGLAWRKRPSFAFGIFFGVVGACAVVAIVWFSGMQRIPVWLPALPVIIVALTLFSFGFLAWRWGRTE
jgi:hypothetical protein